MKSWLKRYRRVCLLSLIAITLWICYWYFYIYNPTTNIAYWPNGQIRHIYHNAYWVSHWEYIDYYENGQIYRIMHFKKWQQHWEFITYYENGQIADIGHWSHQKEDWEFAHYRPTWELRWKWNFIDWLPVDWEYIERYENGDIKRKITYRNWKVEGDDIWYNRDWEIERIWNYDENWDIINISKEWKELKVEEEINEPIKKSSDNEYFLNIDYQIKSWDNYIMQKYVEDPTETPIYLNSFDEEYVWIAEMEWNVLLTWYLENKMVPEAFYYETQEEMDNAPKVENWYIKYYRNWDNNPQTLNLWFMRENIMPGWKWEDAKAIISLGYYGFPTRIDSIYHFHWEELPWEMYGNNLYHFVNDWKVHTFRLEIQWPQFEWDWSYGESVIKNWEILD